MVVAFVAFAMGITTSSYALASEHRAQNCAPRALLERFLRGYNIMTLVFNSVGLVLASLTILRHLRILSLLANVVWMLKDFLIALSLSAAILSLMAVHDAQQAPENPDKPDKLCGKLTPSALLGLEYASIILYSLYICLRIFMALFPNRFPSLKF